jgi:hypothetical protein
MLSPTDLILIFLVSKPLFVGLCLLILATRSEPAAPAPRRPHTLPPLPPTPKTLPHHD